MRIVCDAENNYDVRVDEVEVYKETPLTYTIGVRGSHRLLRKILINTMESGWSDTEVIATDIESAKKALLEHILKKQNEYSQKINALGKMEDVLGEVEC